MISIVKPFKISYSIDRSKALEQKKVSLEEKLRATEPDTYVKYKKVEEIELKLEYILTEKKRRYHLLLGHAKYPSFIRLRSCTKSEIERRNCTIVGHLRIFITHYGKRSSSVDLFVYPSFNAAKGLFHIPRKNVVLVTE